MHQYDEVAVLDQPVQSEYASYLALEQILVAQSPRTLEHDEMLFVIVHQVQELWFKLLLHEFAQLQRQLSQGESTQALHTLQRVLSIVRSAVPIDVLETLTPRQFNRFRGALGEASGAQSAQFREIETVLGKRDQRTWQVFEPGTGERARIEDAANRPTIFDSLLRFLARQGYQIPAEVLHRDLSQPHEPSSELQMALLQVYLDDGTAAQICDRLVELDQGVQEWRYRHVSLVERIIGGKPGTGGSSGASYLRGTLFRHMFPDLWAVRSML